MVPQIAVFAHILAEHVGVVDTVIFFVVDVENMLIPCAYTLASTGGPPSFHSPTLLGAWHILLQSSLWRAHSVVLIFLLNALHSLFQHSSLQSHLQPGKIGLVSFYVSTGLGWGYWAEITLPCVANLCARSSQYFFLFWHIPTCLELPSHSVCISISHPPGCPLFWAKDIHITLVGCWDRNL